MEKNPFSAIHKLSKEFYEEIALCESSDKVENLRIKYLGKKGPIQGLMVHLKELPGEEKPRFGEAVNELKEAIAQTIETLKEKLQLREEEARLQDEEIDITEPGVKHHLGSQHVLTHFLHEILDVLGSMGFSVQYGPDIESDYYNFEALNFSKDHPARDMQDTFYIAPDILLRTHTTNVQVRVMERSRPPIRVCMPGRAFRNETVTARSHIFFHQVDGLYIDKGVTFVDLLSTLEEFFFKLFKKKVETRFRASYFPFVEPGMEADVRCIICEGGGCPVCKFSGWLEVLGAGMVHPNVLSAGGVNPDEYSGFAWGMGLERLVMIRHGIKDIRAFSENHLKFLRQFISL
jgi:phenylalanyl-tRNA synthetase alpha chain